MDVLMDAWIWFVINVSGRLLLAAAWVLEEARPLAPNPNLAIYTALLWLMVAILLWCRNLFLKYSAWRAAIWILLCLVLLVPVSVATLALGIQIRMAEWSPGVIRAVRDFGPISVLIIAVVCLICVFCRWYPPGKKC